MTEIRFSHDVPIFIHILLKYFTNCKFKINNLVEVSVSFCIKILEE